MTALLVAALAASGCSDGTPPSAYQHLQDRFRAATGLYGPCFRTIDGQPRRLRDADCFRLREPRRIRGIAVLGFEDGRFFPGRTTMPPEREPSDLWLSIEPDILPQELADRCSDRCNIYVDLIGRRTLVAGRYAHMGAARHMVVVDRIVAARLLR